MKDFEPFDQYSAYDHSKSTVPSSTSANTNEVQGVARYFPPRLSLREHFAGMALQGLLGNQALVNPSYKSEMISVCDLTKSATHYADALIKELNK